VLKTPRRPIMNETRRETQDEELKQFLKRAAEAGRKVIEDFKKDRAKRDHYEVMENIHRRMWMNGDRE
jgi:hypothetical protein